MQVRASSGQVIRLDLVADQDGIISVDVDRPLISVRFSVRMRGSATTAANDCVLSTSNVVQFDGTNALSMSFRIPFAEQGIDGEIDVEGVTPVDVVSEITITGAVKDARVEVI